MPVLPMMPTEGDQVGTPMPGQMPANMVPGGPTGPGPGGDLASLMAGAPPSAGVDPLQGALGQFDQLAQMIADLARMFPGTESLASQMMELLDQWRQQVLVTITPQPSAMPGADMMM
jgi:hypothetical protein